MRFIAVILSSCLISSPSLCAPGSLGSPQISNLSDAHLSSSSFKEQALCELLASSFTSQINRDAFLHRFTFFNPAWATADAFLPDSGTAEDIGSVFFMKRHQHHPALPRGGSLGGRHSSSINNSSRLNPEWWKRAKKNLWVFAIPVAAVIIYLLPSHQSRNLQTPKISIFSPSEQITQTPKAPKNNFMPDPDQNRVEFIRKQFLAFLKDYKINSSIKDGPTRIHLSNVFSAYISVADRKKGIFVFRNEALLGAFATSGFGGAEHGSEDDQVSINSYYFEPLLKLASKDPFYSDILMGIVLKEGSIYLHSNSLDEFKILLINQAAMLFEQHDVFLDGRDKNETVRTLAGVLVELESIGFESVDQWYESRHITLAVLQAHKEENPAIEAVLGASRLVLKEFNGRSPREKLLSIRSRILWTELARTHPGLVQAVRELPEMKGVQIGQDGLPLPSEKAFGWLLNPKYNISGYQSSFLPPQAHNLYYIHTPVQVKIAA